MHVKTISFKSSGGTAPRQFKLQSLPFKDEVIIRKSIEFFNDPEPCFIHRSAVITRLIAEMDDYLFALIKSGTQEIPWTDFPEKFREMLELEKNISSLGFNL